MEVSEKRARMIGEERIPKVVLKFAIPTIIAMLVNAIYNAADAFFVAKLGVSEVGAISVVFPLFMLILGIGLTFGTGAASYVSRLLGKGDKEQANKTTSTAFFSTLIFSGIFTTMTLIFIEPFLRLLGATDTIIPYAVKYSKIILLGCIFPIITRTMNNIVRAEGNVIYSTIVMILGAVINIIIDPIFIFTFNMGVKGAALATVLSQAITTLLFLIYFFTGKSYCKVSFKYFKPSSEIYSQIIKIGLPVFMLQVLSSLALGMLNKGASPYGDAAVAALGILNRVFAISMYVVFAFSKGFQPIAGYNYGAEKFARLKEAINYSVRWTTTFCIIVTILSVVFAKPIIGIFNDNPAVVDIGSRGLIAINLMFPFFGFQMIYVALFLALGKGKEGGILSLARQGIFFIPAILILPRIFGLNGVLYTQIVADFFTVILTTIFARKVRKEIDAKLLNIKINTLENC